VVEGLTYLVVTPVQRLDITNMDEDGRRVAIRDLIRL